jgi:hypothetical protein
VEIVAALAQRMCDALVRAGDIAVERHRDAKSEARHQSPPLQRFSSKTFGIATSSIARREAKKRGWEGGIEFEPQRSL